MTYLQALEPTKFAAVQKLKPLFGPIVVAVCFLTAYFPTFESLLDGPWQTEQEGHGPLIIVAALWLIWQSRHRIKSAAISPALRSGWAALLAGLILMFLARTQGVLTVETFSAIPVIVGCVLILGGWSILRVLTFPIFFLLFAVPVPDWAIDAGTVPLKVFISDAVTQVLYAAGYPIAQNGVMIMIGSYQLLVKDACSGMNSIFALSAIGLFDAYTFRRNEKVRGLLLLAAIVPITILANFLRVLVVTLIAYYQGTDVLERGIHDVTGIGLFIVAVTLMFLFDGFLGLLALPFKARSKRIGAHGGQRSK
jgi:exosortase B